MFISSGWNDMGIVCDKDSIPLLAWKMSASKNEKCLSDENFNHAF